jgi:hypothetical protein
MISFFILFIVILMCFMFNLPKKCQKTMFEKFPRLEILLQTDEDRAAIERQARETREIEERAAEEQKNQEERRASSQARVANPPQPSGELRIEGIEIGFVEDS